MTGRNDFCWCGSGKKFKKCHYPDQNPNQPTSFAELKKLYYRKHEIILKTDEQIEGIRQAGKLAVDILEATCRMAKEGVTTEELNQFAHQLHVDAGARPAPLHYGHPPYPKSICTSLNEVICHGIPDDVPLKDGDIMNIDVSCELNGYYGDCSQMVQIGTVDKEKQLVCDVAYHSLMAAIAVVKPGGYVCDIGDAIEDYAAKHGCSVVHQFVGHGCGLEFHEGPQVPHNRNRMKIKFVPGMTFTIEPMINAGVREGVIDPTDQWTARTADGRASGQWEQLLLVTEDGCESLTPWNVVSGSY